MKKNPTIIVTGATRGLGLDFCKYISKFSWNIIMVDIGNKAFSVYRENKSIDEIKKKLFNKNKLFFYYTDLTNEKNVIHLFKKIKKLNIKINGLVNFAGGDITGKDTKAGGGKPSKNDLFIDNLDYKNVYERNFFSTFYMNREFVKNYKKQNFKSKIVNVSSISGTYGVINEFAYSSAKSNIIFLTRSLANYARKFNINVNCIAPCGTTSARFLKTIKKRGKKDLSRLKLKGLEGFANPKDISKVVYFLLSDLSDFVSGQIIRIDGGENTAPF